MEYYRDPKHQIYADLAFRLGRIITQYEKIVINEEKFEASLHIAVLQNLLTIFNENNRLLSKITKSNSLFKKQLIEPFWGIDERCWIENTFHEEHSLENFISRIRNSVSHPTNIDINCEFPSTGYTTIKNDSGIISKFRFINSPDTVNNRLKQYPLDRVNSIIYNNGRNGELKIEIPDGTKPKEFLDYPERYHMELIGKPFIRISIIELSVSQLKLFVKGLANYLAQPIQENWNGFTIKDLLAA